MRSGSSLARDSGVRLKAVVIDGLLNIDGRAFISSCQTFTCGLPPPTFDADPETLIRPLAPDMTVRMSVSAAACFRGRSGLVIQKKSSMVMKIANESSPLAIAIMLNGAITPPSSIRLFASKEETPTPFAGKLSLQRRQHPLHSSPHPCFWDPRGLKRVYKSSHWGN